MCMQEATGRGVVLAIPLIYMACTRHFSTGAGVHRSVATRKRPWTETPAPPPMQMPSSSATCGFISCPSVWLSEYSSRKNLVPGAGALDKWAFSHFGTFYKLCGYILRK